MAWKRRETKKSVLTCFIIFAILLLVLFFLIASSHCGFYTGKCR
jgi:hypothetical protein